jgi:hypothetical protein
MNRNKHFRIKSDNLFIIIPIHANLSRLSGEQVCVSVCPIPCSARLKTSRRSNLNIENTKHENNQKQEYWWQATQSPCRKEGL